MTDRKPEIGDWVLYIPRPGQVRANQSKLAALVVMINMDGSLELEVHPWNSEHVWQSRVPQESERYASHCWRFKNVARETSHVEITTSAHQWTAEELAALSESVKGKAPIVRNTPKKAVPAS